MVLEIKVYLNCVLDMDLSFVVKNGPLSDHLISHLLHGVLTGVWYLHRRGYVHCDLKCKQIVH